MLRAAVFFVSVPLGLRMLALARRSIFLSDAAGGTPHFSHGRQAIFLPSRLQW